MSMDISDEEKDILDSASNLNIEGGDIFDQGRGSLIDVVDEKAEIIKQKAALRNQKFELLKEAGVQNIDLFDKNRNYVDEVSKRLKVENRKKRLLEEQQKARQEQERNSISGRELAARVQGPMTVEELAEASDFLDKQPPVKAVVAEQRAENYALIKAQKEEEERLKRQEEADKLKGTLKFHQRKRDEKLGITKPIILPDTNTKVA